MANNRRYPHKLARTPVHLEAGHQVPEDAGATGNRAEGAKNKKLQKETGPLDELRKGHRDQRKPHQLMSQ